MYEFLKRKYDEHKIGSLQIEEAIAKGWLTQEEADNILNGGDTIA